MKILDRLKSNSIKDLCAKASRRTNKIFSQEVAGSVLFGFYLSGFTGHLLFSTVGKTAGWTVGLTGSLFLNLFWKEAEEWAESHLEDVKETVEEATDEKS